MNVVVQNRCAGPHRVVACILKQAVEGTKLMMETREADKLMPSYPRKLIDTEVRALQEVFPMLVSTFEEFVARPEAKDVLISSVCNSESMVRLLRIENLKTVLDLWQCDPGLLKGLFERCRVLGTKNEFQMYFFVNH
jgi:hypothetical protein